MAEAIRRVYEIDVKASADAVRAIKQISTSTQGLERQFSSLRSTMSGFVSGLASAFTAGAFIGAIRGQIKAMDELGDASERAQVSIETFSQLSFVFDQADASQQELSVGLKFLAKAMNEVNDPASKAAKVMASLGIDLRGKPVEEQIRSLADAFVQIQDPAKRLGVALEFFGKGGEAWIPVLAKGGDEIVRLMGRSDALGATLSGSTKKGIDDFDKAMKESQVVINSVFREIAIGLLPALTKLTTGFVESKDGLTEWKVIGEGIGLVIKVAASGMVILSGALKTVGQTIGSFLAIGDRIQNFKGFGDILQDIDQNAVANQLATTRALSNLWGEQIPLDLRHAGRAIEDFNKKITVNEGKLGGALGGGNVKKQVDEAAKAWAAFKKSQLDAELEIAKLIAQGDDAAAKERFEVQSRASERYRDVLKSLEDPLEKIFKLETDRNLAVKNAIREGALTDQIEIATAYKKITDDTTESLKALDDAAKKTDPAFKELMQAVDDWGEETIDTMLDIATNAKGLGDAFTDLVTSILRDLARIQLQKNLRPLLEAATNFDWGSLFSSAKGNVFHGGALQPFARGGLVTQPTIFPMASGGAGLMGEAGFEAVMPLKRGSDGRLGVEGSGVVVNVNNYTSSEVSVQESQDGRGGTRLDIMIDQKISASLASGKHDNTLRSNFGVTRRGF